MSHVQDLTREQFIDQMTTEYSRRFPGDTYLIAFVPEGTDHLSTMGNVSEDGRKNIAATILGKDALSVTKVKAKPLN
jgi:hypothetical protein